MELRDEDLLLRPPRPDDADAIVAACSDEQIVRYIPLMPAPYRGSDAQWWIDRAGEVWRDGSACPFVILDAASGALLGAIEIRPCRGDIGYWITAEARGRGVATRALRLICEWRAERPLWLVTHPDNIASQRVAEKAGFRRIGLQPHEPPFRDGTTPTASIGRTVTAAPMPASGTSTTANSECSSRSTPRPIRASTAGNDAESTAFTIST